MDAPTILILEDDPMIAPLLRHVLQNAGYRVLNARNAEDAVQVGRSHRSELLLLLCDVVLQDGTGPDVARCIEALCPQVKTLFTSGYPLDLLVERGYLTSEMLQNDKTFYIQKPFRPHELLSAVQAIVGYQHEPATRRRACAGVAHASAAY